MVAEWIISLTAFSSSFSWISFPTDYRPLGICDTVAEFQMNHHTPWKKREPGKNKKRNCRCPINQLMTTPDWQRSSTQGNKAKIMQRKSALISNILTPTWRLNGIHFNRVLRKNTENGLFSRANKKKDHDTEYKIIHQPQKKNFAEVSASHSRFDYRNSKKKGNENCTTHLFKSINT